MMNEKQIQDRIMYLKNQNLKLESMAKRSKQPEELGKCVMYALENEHRINELVKVLKNDNKNKQKETSN